MVSFLLRWIILPSIALSLCLSETLAIPVSNTAMDVFFSYDMEDNKTTKGLLELITAAKANHYDFCTQTLKRPVALCSQVQTSAQALCLAGGRVWSSCERVTNISQGLCLARGRLWEATCQHVTNDKQLACIWHGKPAGKCLNLAADVVKFSPAQELCLVAGRSSKECPADLTLAQALCLSGGRKASVCAKVETVAHGICLRKAAKESDCLYFTDRDSTADREYAYCIGSGLTTQECERFHGLNDRNMPQDVDDMLCARPASAALQAVSFLQHVEYLLKLPK